MDTHVHQLVDPSDNVAGGLSIKELVTGLVRDALLLLALKAGRLLLLMPDEDITLVNVQDDADKRIPLMSDNKFSQMLTQLESHPEYGGGSGSGGCGDDELGDDEDGGEDEEDEDDSGGRGGGVPPPTGDDPPIVLINNLDVGNPLYVHNSNNSSSVLVPFKLLGTENYRMWNNAMKLALQARNKYGFVDGTCLRDSYADSEVLFAQWDRCNAMVLTWIMNVVYSDVYMGLVYFENVASVWKDLNETYDKVDGSVIYNLLQKIGSVKYGGSTVADYYYRLNSLWREIDAFTKLPKCVCLVKCSCAASTELALHQQLMKLVQFLVGLDDCYQPVRTALLTRDPLPEVKDAYATISREESHKVIPKTSEAIDTKINATTFVAKCYELIGYPPRYKKGSNKQNGIKPNFKANCDTKGVDKQPTTCNSPTSFTADQMQKILNLINDTTSGNTQANMAGRISFFNGNDWFNVNLSKFYCFLVKTITLGWIIDSGANQHLTTSTIGMINVVDISNLNITVGHPNGTVATISHVGDLRLSNNVILYDVLVVLGYCVILLSVNKLIKDSKLFVGFDEDKCYIQDLDKGITLGTGSESGGLYLFDDTKNKSLGNVNSVMAFNVSKDMWHNRLGHLADQVLNVLKVDLNLSKNTSVSICETCHMAKQTREPFPLSDHKSVKPGELVHLDLWGPYRVSSKEGFKLPSSVLNGSDKLTSRSVLFSRDVRFYETIFPFKMKNTKGNDLADVDYTSDAELLTLFDNQITPSPNDEERETPCVEGRGHSNTDAALVQAIEEDSATHIGNNTLFEGNIQDENPDLNIVEPSRDHIPEEGQSNVRMSSRPIKMPAKFNDYMLDSKLKSGIKKHVNYSKLNTVNYCFATTLNKSMEPTTYYDAVKDFRWVEAMNNEIKALIRNNSWILTDLPIGRKTIDNKGLYKIKCKPLVKLTSIRCLICIVVSNNWPLFQLDVNNAFLLCDLMKISKCIEVINNSNGICMTQRKYCLELIHEFGVLAAKPVTTPLLENCVLAVDENPLFLGKARNKPLYPDPLMRLNTDVWQVPLINDSNSAIQIAANPVFHERTKYFKVDVHLVREKVQDGVINTIKVASTDQIADCSLRSWHYTALEVVQPAESGGYV
ncbi:ribonuclease H-like domain-containing protein [Tanacetum coccineum]